MRNKRKLHGSFKGLADAWGDHLTADHITSQKDAMLGITGDRDAFMVKDLYSGLKHLYPTKSKNAEDTQLALQNFIGMQGGGQSCCTPFGRAKSMWRAGP